MEYFDKQKNYMLDLGFSAEHLESLKKYVQLLWQSNEELNLISRKMPFEELIDNHIIDCLLPLKQFPVNLKRVADFGSGGGLPAVIYAIQFPETEFYLYEKSPKKQEFLKKCQSIAKNIQVFGEIPKTLEKVDLVTARGFKPVDVILDVSREYYKSGGQYFLLKARAEKITEELQLAQKKFKDISSEIIPLKSPLLDVQRHVVWIKRK